MTGDLLAGRVALVTGAGSSRWITGTVLPLGGGRRLATNRPPVE